MLNLEYAPPPEGMAEFVAAFYLFESDEESFSDIERADVAQFRVILDGNATYELPDGTRLPSPPVSILGPRLCATKVHAHGGPPLRLFGVGLLPAGWALAVAKPADKAANAVLSADAFLKFDVAAFHAQLTACANFSEMVDATVDLIHRFYAGAHATPLWFIRAVDAWLESKLMPDIADLEVRTGLSRRQIERLCRQHYGAPPKFLVRKYRALRSASLIANGNGGWQDFVDEAYYDQPHFIREVKEFVGMTPGQIRNTQSRLSQLVFGRAKLHGEVKLLVSST